MPRPLRRALAPQPPGRGSAEPALRLAAVGGHLAGDEEKGSNGEGTGAGGGARGGGPPCRVFACFFITKLFHHVVLFWLLFALFVLKTIDNICFVLTRKKKGGLLLVSL